MGKLAYLSVLFLLAIFSHLHATANARKFPPSQAGGKKHDIHVSTITMVKKMLQVPEGEAQTGTVEEGNSETETEGTKSEDDSKTETVVESKLKGDSETERETETEDTKSKGDLETENGTGTGTGTEDTKSKGDSETKNGTEGESKSQTETEVKSESQTETEVESESQPETEDDSDNCVGKPCDRYVEINDSDEVDPYYCKYDGCECSTLFGIGIPGEDDGEEPHCMDDEDGLMENFTMTKDDDVFYPK